MSKNSFVRFITSDYERFFLILFLISAVFSIGYSSIWIRVYEGEYYISDKNGRFLPPGLYFRAFVSKADTTVQYASFYGKDGVSIDHLYNSKADLHFMLQGQKYKAKMPFRYRNNIGYYYPRQLSSSNITTDFNFVLQEAGKKYTFYDVNNQKEAFAAILIREFNRITTSESELLDLKILDFQKDE